MNTEKFVHKQIMRSITILSLIALALFAAVPQPEADVALAQSGGVTVLAGQGISFNQVDFTWTGATTLNSNTGEINVNIATLRASTGITSGFINVATNLGWVVQNLPVFSGFPYPSISANFDLGTAPGVDATSLDAFVEFSRDPVTSFVGGSFTIFPVGAVEFNAEGEGGNVTAGPPVPPAPGAVTFQVGGALQAAFQPNHPNLQTADNQCLPAAVSTSFQWLENTYRISVPHPNVLGLGVDANADGNADDGSLVGQLDIEMRRTFRNRRDGDPTPIENGLRGKLRYIAKNGLSDDLIIKHQGELGGGNVTETWPGPDGKLGTADDVTATSWGQGTTVTADFIINEIKKGEDLELGFLYVGGGGHRVQVVAAGTILGIPFVLHQSDYKQSDTDNAPPPAGDGINDNEGTDRVDFSFLVDTDGDGSLNLVYNKRDANIYSVFSQSVKRPIGGVIVPVNRVELLAPWLGLAALVVAVTAAVAVRRRVA